MFYLLLGPTGVGKTTLGKAAAAALPNGKFYELEKLVIANTKMATADDVMRVQGPDHYWRLCARILQEIKKRHAGADSIGLCAVGSLTLRSATARSPLAKYPRSILLWGKPEEVYKRSGWWPDKPLHQFVTAEYGTYAKAVYEKLGEGLRFDTTGMNATKASEKFAAWFRDVVESAGDEPAAGSKDAE